MQFSRLPLSIVAPVALGIVGASMVSASQQAGGSRPVVQPLPSAEGELRDALRALKRNPGDIEALLNAGYASIKVNDLNAAINFLRRAEEADPNDPRVKQGQASVYLRSGRPVVALRLFEQAEAAGAPVLEVLSDKGLAYDLVGDQLRAQAHYREALKERPNDYETIRRMAVSQAIAGNQLAFDETLRPLIDQQDIAAFRARAFGMAILKEQERAEATTRELIPKDLADKIVPYLAYMPRLTKAQQAAAANLGIFPVPQDIGRDSPEIAQYSSGSAGAATSGALARAADNRLEPSGQPFGSPTSAAAQTNRAEPARTRSPQPTDTAAPQPARKRVLQRVPSQETVVVVSRGDFEPTIDAMPPRQASRNLAAPASVQSQSANAERVPSLATNAAPSPGPEIGNASGKSATLTRPAPAISFDDAFATVGPAKTSELSVSGDVVDISAISIPREAEARPGFSLRSAPSDPQRFWLRLGTGKNASLFVHDWRTLSGKAAVELSGLSGHYVPAGDSFILLAGPISSREAMEELVRKLTDKGISVLPFESSKGEKVQKLN